ncbi:hypothetical protein GCM10011521_12370 [Arenimonas soli]|uniref:Uncharacterized protein n=1 Tax=Arenimonas soli TaxID=2269504 RepID=A0ABQ1HFV1_9GAMM|nr:hypothetical protein [Arenimonas soli]GGA75734.1 hypothetical protein GCM10011521_12370 [Arenimonas soli]
MPFRLALITLALLAAPALAADHDAVVKAQLESKGTPFTIDEDGDFQITVRVAGDRTQLVWVRSTVQATGQFKVREIWSPGYRAPTGDFTAAIANDLLERSNNLKLGAWVKQDDVAMLVIKVPADASADALDEAIDLAAAAADAVERQLLGSDEL